MFKGCTRNVAYHSRMTVDIAFLLQSREGARRVFAGPGGGGVVSEVCISKLRLSSVDGVNCCLNKCGMRGAFYDRREHS